MHKYTQFISQFLICKMKSIVLIHTTQFILHQLNENAASTSMHYYRFNVLCLLSPTFEMPIKVETLVGSDQIMRAKPSQMRLELPFLKKPEMAGQWWWMTQIPSTQADLRVQGWPGVQTEFQSRLHRESLSRGKKRNERYVSQPCWNQYNRS